MIPWTKLRGMRRWMAALGVQIGSEKQMRKISQEIIGDNLAGEEAPFYFSTRHRMDIQPAPHVYIPDLVAKVFDVLEQNERTNRLTWHDDAIPSDEIWVKIGGDKGGKSMKASFQICNVPRPNSVQNTVIFSIFEARDSVVNLHVALDRYSDQIKHLQSTLWRGKKIRVFLFGDYEFECRMVGITGAQGRHPCLWCTIRGDEMKVPRDQRSTPSQRSLNSLEADYLQFQANGKGDIRKVKDYNNVMERPFFNIPIRQVCPPGLHITLGIFFRLWSLLEEDCHLLDVELAKRTAPESVDRAAFVDYSTAIKKQSQLKEQRLELEKYIATLTCGIAQIALQVATPEVQSIIIALQQEASSSTNKLQDVERQISDIDIKCKDVFPTEDGPFIRALDETLGRMNVHREAYYGGTFTGNHAHKCLSAANVDAICATLPRVAAARCPDMDDIVESVANKYGRALLLYSKCHQAFNSSRTFRDEELTSLQSDIDAFLAHYRATFPNASITPKLHMVEDHVVEFVRRWKVGIGMLGEQGAESIHTIFNQLERTYSNMTNKVDRLKSMVTEHFRQTCPDNIVRQPPPAKKRRPGLEE